MYNFFHPCILYVMFLTSVLLGALGASLPHLRVLWLKHSAIQDRTSPQYWTFTTGRQQ